ncbi:DNA-binding protein [Oscillospiraceae bacterium PP1C4]
MECLTAQETVGKWSITAKMVNYYCSASRIDGAIKKRSLWLVPGNIPIPTDGQAQGGKVKQNGK